MKRFPNREQPIMHAEIIAIGDELTSGQRLDTNSQWLSQRLGELGIRVLYHTTVGDDLDANVRVFREAFARADLIICTGGLGPTADDLTRHALAAATETELVLDEASLAHIEALFARRKREMPERNTIQAMFPAGSSVVPNPHGSAPGIDMAVARGDRVPSRLFALPGVPAEMREMWEGTVLAQICQLVGGTPRVIRHHAIKCFGVGESDLEAMLPDLIQRGRVPSVGITVSRATITLRISAEAEDDGSFRELIQPTVATIHDCLGNLIFGEGDDELHHAVIDLLRQREQTLATAEWGPGGLLAEWLSDVDKEPGAFVGGFVFRDAMSLSKTLGVEGAITSDDSAETVAATADRLRQHFNTDYGLVIGPFPSSDSETSEPGQLQLALAGPSGIESKSVAFAGHPDILRARSVKQALNLLRLRLITPTE